MNNIFWSVKNVSVYENFFKSGITETNNFKRNYELIKNLSYNCQYLEFLYNSLEQEIHPSLKVEFIKTFVITGMSIVESYLHYLLKELNLQKTTLYEEVAIFDSNQKQIQNQNYKIETRIRKKLEKPKDSVMNLDYLLKKTESKKIFGENSEMYKQLNYLRKLRNKIHLFIVEEKLDHDFNNFTENEMEIMKNALRVILFSDNFTANKNVKIKVFDFIV